MKSSLIKKIAVLFTGLMSQNGCAGSYKHIGVEAGTKSGGFVTLKVCTPQCDTPVNTVPPAIRSSVKFLTDSPTITSTASHHPTPVSSPNRILTVPSSRALSLPQSYIMQPQYNIKKPAL